MRTKGHRLKNLKLIAVGSGFASKGDIYIYIHIHIYIYTYTYTYIYIHILDEETKVMIVHVWNHI